ncbi:MAG: hypothetical protein ACI4TF_13165, partial [Oliverpabstia sp.]
MGIIFESTGEKITHKKDDIIVKMLAVFLLNRSIVFVNNDNRCSLMVFMQHKVVIEKLNYYEWEEFIYMGAEKPERRIPSLCNNCKK